MQKLFNKFYNQFIVFTKSSNMESKTINKFIKKSIYQKILSIKYSYETRYMEDVGNSPFRWTKSIFRRSFAEFNAKKAKHKMIKLLSGIIDKIT